jgi:hypothetical protein
VLAELVKQAIGDDRLWITPIVRMEILYSEYTPVETELDGFRSSYSTKGNYAAGAVLGTRRLAEDLCEGTLISRRHRPVAVTNFVNHRHLTVTAGHSYLAKAP